MVPAVIAIAFILALCSSGASAKYHADDKTVPAAAPSQSESGSSLFQHGTGRSFVVSARGASSKSEMYEPRSELLLGEGDGEDEDGLMHGAAMKKSTPASVSEDVNDPAFYLGVCLDILVFLIILDGVRRYCSTPKETTQQESQPQTGTTGGLSRALMTQQ